tara:strand:- start:10737 stop:10895 length:159 start_codon:yes stop_codon:yes gene_type:complete
MSLIPAEKAPQDALLNKLGINITFVFTQEIVSVDRYQNKIEKFQRNYTFKCD